MRRRTAWEVRPPRASLERLAEYYKRDDDGRRLVERMSRPFGKEPGKGNRKSRVEPGRPRPESDQCVHVGVVPPEGRPSPGKKAATDIHHDRDCQKAT